MLLEHGARSIDDVHIAMSWQVCLRVSVGPKPGRRSMRCLQQDVLGQTTTAPMTSRVRTWHEWNRSWGVKPFPLEDAFDVSALRPMLQVESEQLRP